MNFMVPLIAVKNVKESIKFYENVLKQEMTLDLGENVTMSGKFALQENYTGLVGDPQMVISQKANDHELYFEEEDYDRFEEHLAKFSNLVYLHKSKEYPWGQRVVRFYDPDFHIIEVGESMVSVFKRFYSQGMSVEEVAQRTMHPLEYVKNFIG